MTTGFNTVYLVEVYSTQDKDLSMMYYKWFQTRKEAKMFLEECRNVKAKAGIDPLRIKQRIVKFVREQQ